MDSLKNKYNIEGLKNLIKNIVHVIRISFAANRQLYIGVLAGSLVVSVLPFLKQGAYALLVDAAVLLHGTIYFVVALVAFLLVVPEFIYNLKGYLDRRYILEIQKAMEAEYLERKGRIDVARYEDPKFNNLLNTANERGLWPIVNLGDNFIQNIQNIVGVIVASFILAFYDWKLFLLIGVALIPKLYIEIVYGREVWGIFSAGAHERRRYWDLRGHFYNISNLTELKLFQNVKHFRSIILSILTNFTDKQKKNEGRRLFLSLGSLVVSGAAYLYFGFSVVRGALAGLITPGSMIFVIGSVIEFGNALSGFFMNIGRQYQENLFANDLFKIMEIEPLITQPKNPVQIGKNIPPRIEFDNVSFRYPKGEFVLRDVSFTLEPGEKLALVGVNGVGKTTLIKLLCRFYDPTEGRILVNGNDLREIDLTEWWSILGVLFQDFSSYNFLTREAIALGRSDAKATRERVVGAAKMSEADEFISKWEKGYEQMLGKEFENGIDPSKGQIQKLALARVFFRNPRIMVLDEPTASVDTESEAKIFEKFTTLPKNVSAILISHRFSTVRRTDKIIVLKDKTISEMGNHDELMNRKGIYARLFRLQAEGYRD